MSRSWRSAFRPIRPSTAKCRGRFHLAAANADTEAYFGCFAEDAVFLGTDPSERWTLGEFREFATPYFERGTGWKYECRSRHLGFDDDARTAWFDEILFNEKYGNVRGSGVLTLSEGEWRIRQYNLTFMVPNDLALDLVEKIRAHQAEQGN